jgi:hypothetical protein
MLSNDPRISQLFANESPAIQFIAAGISALLGPKKSEALMSDFAPRGIDWTEVVGGKPMHYWNGKTRQQIADEAGEETADKVGDALQARGIDFPEAMEKSARRDTVEGGGGGEGGDDPEAERLRAAAANADKFPGPGVPSASGPQGQRINPPAAEHGGEGEPTFGGYPYSELAGKSDAELLATPNIGEKTIQAIRSYEAGRR